MDRADAEPVAPRRADLGGRTLGGRYRLIRRLGAGGMGEVWEAENDRTGRRVALKLLDAERTTDSAQVARFLQEARSAARIVHPNVVDVLDLDRDGDVLFIVQELLVGEDLESLLRARTKLPLGEALDIALPALRGLAFAHARGVVHRDVKPSNVFLAREPDGTMVPKIIDFGISKITGDDAPTLVLTTTGEIFGTPAYMAPEQLRGARGVDARADVWAFGVLLYECLSGVLPVAASNYNVLVHEVLSGRRAALREVAPEVPEDLAAVVMRALAMSPADRYPDAQALHDALAPFATRTTPAPAPAPARRADPTPSTAPTLPALHVTPAAPVTAPAPSPPRPRWVAPVSAFVTLAALGLAYTQTRPAQIPPAPVTRAPVAKPPPAAHDAGPIARAAPDVVTAPPAVAAEPAVTEPATRSAHRRHGRRTTPAPEPAAPAPAPAPVPAPAPALAPGGAYPGP